MNEHIIYVGLDVHKETISVALADESKRAEVREHGQISNTPAALTRLSSKPRILYGNPLFRARGNLVLLLHKAAKKYHRCRGNEVATRSRAR